MLDQINAGLLRAKEHVRAKRKLEAMLQETQQVLRDAQQRCDHIGVGWKRKRLMWTSSKVSA